MIRCPLCASDWDDPGSAFSHFVTGHRFTHPLCLLLNVAAAKLQGRFLANSGEFLDNVFKIEDPRILGAHEEIRSFFKELERKLRGPATYESRPISHIVACERHGGTWYTLTEGGCQLDGTELKVQRDTYMRSKTESIGVGGGLEVASKTKYLGGHVVTMAPKSVLLVHGDRGINFVVTDSEDEEDRYYIWGDDDPIVDDTSFRQNDPEYEETVTKYYGLSD